MPDRRLKDSMVRAVLRRVEVRGYIAHRVPGKAFVYQTTIAPTRLVARGIRDPTVDSGLARCACPTGRSDRLLTLSELERFTRRKTKR